MKVKEVIAQFVSRIQFVVNIKDVSTQQQDIRYNEFKRLNKEATVFKKSDINRSLECIQESHLKYPEFVEYSNIYRLSRFEQLAGNQDKVYSTMRKFLDKAKQEDPAMKDMMTSVYHSHMCTIQYDFKIFESYIAHYCSWIKFLALGFACQGRIKELMDLLDNKDKATYLTPSKTIEALSSLNITLDQINGGLSTYFEERKNCLLQLAKLQEQTGGSNINVPVFTLLYSHLELN